MSEPIVISEEEASTLLEDDEPKCNPCSDYAAAVIFAPNGCTCLTDPVQARCFQHMQRVQDSDYGNFSVIRDLSMEGKFSPTTPYKIKPSPV